MSKHGGTDSGLPHGASIGQVTVLDSISSTGRGKVASYSLTTQCKGSDGSTRPIINRIVCDLQKVSYAVMTLMLKIDFHMHMSLIIVTLKRYCF
jgi:hypothetical protein